MTKSQHQRNWGQRNLLKFTSSIVGAKIASRVLHRFDKVILKRTQNRSSLTSILSGIPVIVLTTTGAKSGLPRTVPLLGVVKDKDIFLIASNWGQAKHPAWYYNLKANPQAHISYKGNEGDYIARDATIEEREAYWKEAVDMYPGYAKYKKRIKTREIPMFILSPVESSDKINSN